MVDCYADCACMVVAWACGSCQCFAYNAYCNIKPSTDACLLNSVNSAAQVSQRSSICQMITELQLVCLAGGSLTSQSKEQEPT